MRPRHRDTYQVEFESRCILRSRFETWTRILLVSVWKAGIGPTSVSGEIGLPCPACLFTADFFKFALDVTVTAAPTRRGARRRPTRCCTQSTPAHASTRAFASPAPTPPRPPQRRWKRTDYATTPALVRRPAGREPSYRPTRFLPLPLFRHSPLPGTPPHTWLAPRRGRRGLAISA